MGRAIGSNASVASVFETLPGITPASGFFAVPFVSHTLGEERPLIASDLLGYGREPQDPIPDVANDTGDIVVPVDVRNFGRWLKLAFGAPSSNGAPAAATGNIVFNNQPVANSSVTINGRVFTFVAGTPGLYQVQIGVNLSTTLANLAAALNASSVNNVTPATYAVTGGTTLTVTFDVAGPGGNSFSLAASVAPASNATPSGATLTGGAVATHVFSSGAQALPSLSLEIGAPEVPAYSVNYGARLNQLKIALARSGLLNATCSLIAIGETTTVGTSVAGTPTALVPTRFAQATGSIIKDGVTLGEVVSADFTFSNNLEAVETIKADGRIEDSDPGMVMMSGSLTVRFASTLLLAQAQSGLPCELDFGWVNGPFGLTFRVPRVFLPAAKRPITGPKGIQASYNWQASGQNASSVAVTLVNDVSSYAA